MNKTFYLILVAIGLAIAVPGLTRADYYSAAKKASSEGEQVDIAEEEMNSFVLTSDDARNLADVYGTCTENPQDGNWQGDPRRRRLPTPTLDSENTTPQKDDNISLASFSMLSSPSGTGDNSGYSPNQDEKTTPPKNGDGGTPPVVATPEPATLLLLGMGLVGLAPLSLRGRKKS